MIRRFREKHGMPPSTPIAPENRSGLNSEQVELILKYAAFKNCALEELEELRQLLSTFTTSFAQIDYLFNSDEGILWKAVQNLSRSKNDRILRLEFGDLIIPFYASSFHERTYSIENYPHISVPLQERGVYHETQIYNLKRLLIECMGIYLAENFSEDESSELFKTIFCNDNQIRECAIVKQRHLQYLKQGPTPVSKIDIEEQSNSMTP